jgi:eukaryotic-like serine/threonine-protein kinase
MDPERWREIKRIYNSALEFELDKQEGFLIEACGGDDSLRNEVESLLDQQRDAQSFMKDPAMEVAAHALARGHKEANIKTLAGQSVAHYRIMEKIGEGGMGVVYRAQDTRLNRDVAIKSLPDIFAADPSRMARFDREGAGR